MEQDIKSLVRLINATPTKAVIYVTGGGLDVFPWLTKRGGGSATLLDGGIPYAQKASIKLLGGVEPEKLASEEITRKLAMVAFQSALELSDGVEPIVGIAVSSILQKTPDEREGRKHYVYAALQTDTTTISCVLDLGEGVTDEEEGAYNVRESEEDTTARLALNLLAEGCGLKEQISLNYGKAPGTGLQRSESHFPGLSLRKIFNGTPLALDVYPDGAIVVDAVPDRKDLIFPGSFNPPSPAHWEMALIASKDMWSDMWAQVQFEISIFNVDKPALDLLSLANRLVPFMEDTAHRLPGEPIRVWITNAPRFIDKAKQFPGATFIVGYDTAVRICNPKYAGEIESVMQIFKENDVAFYIFGREVNGVYQTDERLFPKSFAYRFFPGRLQHAAVSSTAIRTKQAK